MVKKTSSSKNKNLKYIILIFGATLLVVLATQVFLIKELYRRTDTSSDWKIQALIVQAISDDQSEPVIDPLSGKEYIPVARLVLPPSGEVRTVYSGDKDYVHFSEKTNLNQAITSVYNAQNIDETFAQVPELQACSRQVELQFEQKNEDDLRQVYDKKLADGRMAYFFLNDQCSGDSQTLLEYLKQIQSY
jgi:hypothetical protein